MFFSNHMSHRKHLKGTQRGMAAEHKALDKLDNTIMTMLTMTMAMMMVVMMRQLDCHN